MSHSIDRSAGLVPGPPSGTLPRTRPRTVDSASRSVPIDPIDPNWVRAAMQDPIPSSRPEADPPRASAEHRVRDGAGGGEDGADLTVSLDLVRRAQEGQDGALNRLFERYYDRVRRIVRLRLGRQLRASLDSSDILQETFIAAVRSFDKFEMRDEASLINWLSKLAERQILAAADYHSARKRDRRREIGLPNLPGSGTHSGFVSQLADEATQPLDGLAESEQLRIVEECIQDLDPEQRELVILRDYIGAPWETVAEQTGRPTPAAARMMHARALIELAKLFRARGGKD